MKTIEEMAQKYIEMEVGRVGLSSIDDIRIADAWRIAEAMQAEGEKRKPTPNADPMRKVREAEWQPDWSQAPEWANWYLSFEFGKSMWFENKPIIGISRTVCTGKTEKAPSFNYQGNWKDSLRKRP